MVVIVARKCATESAMLIVRIDYFVAAPDAVATAADVPAVAAAADGARSSGIFPSPRDHRRRQHNRRRPPGKTLQLSACDTGCNRKRTIVMAGEWP